jgi:hypothetical protein
MDSNYQNFQLRKRPKKLSLYKALSIGYLRNERKQKKRLKRFGYILDPSLTNNEHLVAFNPVTKKVIYVSNGSSVTPLKQPTQFYKDWIQTNLAGTGLGRIKETPRYYRDNQTYLAAKQKYKDARFVLAGHSLGGGTVSRIAKPEDKAITLNAALINQKPRANVTNYRVEGDLVSALANDEKVLKDIHKGNLNPFHSHNIDEIKNQPIFI